ncbi:MAG TPA: hypothetical protein VM098_06750 [Phycisphaerae bacterium]|nr:hypothetical protein [Phycisphaerae bacterium]
MHEGQSFTLGQFVVVAVVLGGIAFLLLLILMPTRSANELMSRPVCMSNLSSMGKALTIYRGTNNDQWPWIANVTSDWSSVPTGTNRAKNIGLDPNHPGDRSITSLMFLLVREGMPAKLFVCPSSSETEDPEVVDANVAEDEEPQYCWDFSSDRNVSYSWQAPIREGSRYVSGLGDEEVEAAIAGDKTPLYDDPHWQPDDVSGLRGVALQRNLSRNHGGKHVNVLYVGMNVGKSKRPDIGEKRDNIYTASGNARGGSQSATSLDISTHLSTRDSFLIGPIRGNRGAKE